MSPWWQVRPPATCWRGWCWTGCVPAGQTCSPVASAARRWWRAALMPCGPVTGWLCMATASRFSNGWRACCVCVPSCATGCSTNAPPCLSVWTRPISTWGWRRHSRRAASAPCISSAPPSGPGGPSGSRKSAARPTMCCVSSRSSRRCWRNTGSMRPM